MSKDLVIVESPAKAKTIQKFIGNEYEVVSSKGHVRDLPTKELGIDIEKNFTPKYEILDEKKKLIADIKKMANQAEIVYLATDDDREGEAISWHIVESAKIPLEKVKRIVFHEITKGAIEHALENPRNIDIHLVDAQQARRVLDRIVGFELSPVLWRKVRPQLSAGRVQSVAVKLIVEREHEIQAFQSSSSYRITGHFVSENNTTLDAELNKKFEKHDEVKAFLQYCIDKRFEVSAVEKNPGKKSPAAPFTTSTLQQEASRKLGFSVSKTMMVAQQLYEAGYITYMRTDSVNLSESALISAKEQITALYGTDYHKQRRYSVKSKNAQEAHEAIRPTSFAMTAISGDASAKRLYDLIWKRAIASQMSDAKTEKTQITIPVPGREEKFIATGELILFQGFLKVYIESKDDEENEEVKGFLPAFEIGEKLNYDEIKAVQKFAQAPPRYTEAGLVKKLEELGIGRPSTYAPTISTIQKREYVVKETRPGKDRNYEQLILKGNTIKEEIKKETFGNEKDKLFPTDIGIVVNDYLQENFQDIMDYGFTADKEKELDDIANGEMKWQQMLQNFYSGFHDSVEDATANSAKASGQRLLGTDPKTGKNVYAKLGKFAPMVQIGENGEEEKPKYARLKNTQSIDTINLDEALKLFELPRTVGTYEENEVTVGVGRFGPYIKFNNQFVTIPKGEDPMEISQERCIELIELKRKTELERAPRVLGEHEGKEISVARGRYGPYVKYDNQNFTLDKNVDVQNLTLEEALDAVQNSKTRNVLVAYSENSEIRVMKGRYGAYLTDGTNNFKIPKEMTPENLTYQESLNIIANTTPTTKKKSTKTVRKKK